MPKTERTDKFTGVFGRCSHTYGRSNNKWLPPVNGVSPNCLSLMATLRRSRSQDGKEQSPAVCVSETAQRTEPQANLTGTQNNFHRPVRVRHAHARAATAAADEHAYPLQRKEGKVPSCVPAAGHCFKNPVTEQQGMRCWSSSLHCIFACDSVNTLGCKVW